MRLALYLLLAVLHAAPAQVAGAAGDSPDKPTAAAVAGIGPDDAAGFEVIWFGIYNIAEITLVDDPQSPSQSKGLVREHDDAARDRATAQVSAVPGINFGVAFKFNDAPTDTPIDFHAVWRFPQPGLTNPKSMKTFLVYESGAAVCTRRVCLYGWSFTEPWEMVIGTWTLELWRGSRKLHEQAFEVVAPGAPRRGAGAAGKASD